MAMNFLKSRWFRWTAIVLGTLLIILLALPFLISVDQFRPRIITLLEEQTGRKIEIEKLQLGLIPSIRVEVHGFRVKNPQNFPEGDMLAVDRVDVGAELMPLFEGQLKVTSITVRGVTVNLLENQHGAINYDPTRGAKKAQKAAAAAEDSSAFAMEAIDSIEVRNIRITSGSYHTGRKTVSEGMTLAGLNVVVRNLDLQDADWLNKTEVIVPMAGVTASTSALTVPLRFEGGELMIRDGAGEGNVKAVLDTIRIDGKLRIPNLAKQRAEFSVTIPELDLAKLMALTAGGESESSGESATRSTASNPATERKLLASGSVKIERLLLPPLRAESVSAQIRLYTHKAEVTRFGLKFYDGALGGSATLDRIASGQPFTLNAKLDGVDIGRMMDDAAPDADQKITGTFGASLNLATALAGDPMGNMTGSGNFAVRNGTLPGLNLQGRIMQLSDVLKLGLPETTDTPFSYFGGDLRIEKERVHSQEIRLDSDALELKAAGSFGFDTTINYKGTALIASGEPDTKAEVEEEPQEEEPEPEDSNPFAGLKKKLGKVVGQAIGTASQYRIPLSVKGTFAEPKFGLTGIPQPVK